MKKSNLAITALFATLVVATSCKGTEEHVQEAATYKLLTISNSDISLSSSYSAAIRGKQDIDILPQVGGYLSQIKVMEGDKVKKVMFFS